MEVVLLEASPAKSDHHIPNQDKENIGQAPDNQVGFRDDIPKNENKNDGIDKGRGHAREEIFHENFGSFNLHIDFSVSVCGHFI